MVSPGIRHSPRTDKQYQEMIDEDHYKGANPLNPIMRVTTLVTQIPFESMHLVYIGNVKKILHTRLKGKYGKQKLNKRKVDIHDLRMTDLKVYCLSEFNCRPNKFSMFNHFKAIELRQLLLYTAPAVLQSVINEEYYEHFMLSFIQLHFVIRLFSLQNIPNSTYAWYQKALESYVNLCEEQFLSYNVHGLLHIVDDIARLCPLESYNASAMRITCQDFTSIYENHI